MPVITILPVLNTLFNKTYKPITINFSFQRKIKQKLFQSERKP